MLAVQPLYLPQASVARRGSTTVQGRNMVRWKAPISDRHTVRRGLWLAAKRRVSRKVC
jgi:hypothetical protein